MWPQLFDRAGRLEDALAKLDEGRTAMRRVGLGLAYAGFADGYGASLLFRLGRWDQAARLLAQPTPAALTGLTENVLLARAELELGRGEIPPAAQRLDQAQPRLMGRGWGYQDAWFAKLLAMAALRQGRLDAARATILAGLADVKACEELVCSAWLFGLGLRVEADLAEHARSRRAPAAAAAARQHGARLLGQLRDLVKQAASQGLAVEPELAAHAVVGEAEATRLDGRSDPDRWGGPGC